jgi:prepilin-type N-terminal cleavage/methylation domain-containing protein
VKHSDSGFTLVEVIVAIVVMSVGVIALAGSTGLVTRMIGRGKVDTRVAQVASRRIETLRLTAASTTPRCTAAGFANGGPVSADGLTETWTVSAAGKVRSIQVNVSYRTARGPRTASVLTRIDC